MVINEKIKSILRDYIGKHRRPELINVYLLYVQSVDKVHPVAFPPGKLIYRSQNEALKLLESDGKVWRETEIKITFSPAGVNEQTKKIYICPFTGKVFGNNTHPNPQDAIYDWVSKCSENTERVGGLRVKRFFVSEDPKVIKQYGDKLIQKEPITKIVFSSAQSGKLYHDKEEVIKEFLSSYLKPISLLDVQNQNRYDIEEVFLASLQDRLSDEKIGEFVETLAEDEFFTPFIEQWLEGEEEDEEEVEASSQAS
jgi:hypothetical protein